MQHIDLVFLWHMHQPDYRDHGESARGHASEAEFVLPWVYLHAIKDYADMAAHLERHPKIRAVINFVPVLLEQIEDYVDQFATHHFRDPLLRLLATAAEGTLAAADKQLLLEACFRSNHATMLAPFPGYQRLHAVHAALSGEPTQSVREADIASVDYLTDTYFTDLVTWYHLAWSGESERRNEPLLNQLITKGSHYNCAERHALLAWIGRTLTNLIPRYRALAERGQIEISSTPQTHPLSPLLIDFKAAHDSLPTAPLPSAPHYPGGNERVTAHIHDALISHKQRFGQTPTGMWPAEGAISTAFVQQLAAQGVRWVASGEGVLNNSLHKSNLNLAHPAWQAWRLENAPGLTLFFRDEHLSDLIGFEYGKWHSGDAANHFVAQLEATAAMADCANGQRPIVSVILDGENAWEHYPYNGWYFFEELYALLEANTQISTTTFAHLLEGNPHTATLPHLAAGSWVYGTLSTWIGEAEKNHAWDLLCAAKTSYDEVINKGSLSPDEVTTATQQLAVCESSDWFWWFGDYNPAAAVASFDQLYRRNLTNLYHCLKLTPPATLAEPISAGGGHAEGGGSMRRAQEH